MDPKILDSVYARTHEHLARYDGALSGAYKEYNGKTVYNDNQLSDMAKAIFKRLPKGDSKALTEKDVQHQIGLQLRKTQGPELRLLRKCESAIQRKMGDDFRLLESNLINGLAYAIADKLLEGSDEFDGVIESYVRENRAEENYDYTHHSGYKTRRRNEKEIQAEIQSFKDLLLSGARQLRGKGAGHEHEAWISTLATHMVERDHLTVDYASFVSKNKGG